MARAIAYYIGTNSSAKYVAIGLGQEVHEKRLGSIFVHETAHYVARGFDDVVSAGQLLAEWERDGLTTCAYEANGTPW